MGLWQHHLSPAAAAWEVDNTSSLLQHNYGSLEVASSLMQHSHGTSVMPSSSRTLAMLLRLCRTATGPWHHLLHHATALWDQAMTRCHLQQHYETRKPLTTSSVAAPRDQAMSHLSCSITTRPGNNSPLLEQYHKTKQSHLSSSSTMRLLAHISSCSCTSSSRSPLPGTY